MTPAEYNKARKAEKRARERSTLEAVIDARVVSLAQQFFGVMHAMMLTNQPAVEPKAAKPEAKKPAPRKRARR